MKDKTTNPSKRTNTQIYIVVGLSVLLGMFIILFIRFIFYVPPKETHYHANFVVFVDGQREQFASPLIYEEISECSSGRVLTADKRAHMHDKINDVVHVEDEVVTWGNFFQNIGWNVGPTYLDTSTALLLAGGDKKVTYILNGVKLDSIAGRVIGDKDRLLVSYGNQTNDELNTQYSAVASTAAKYNEEKDPAACSGNHATNSLLDKLNHLF